MFPTLYHDYDIWHPYMHGGFELAGSSWRICTTIPRKEVAPICHRVHVRVAESPSLEDVQRSYFF
jgi:hypothetical protein